MTWNLAGSTDAKNVFCEYLVSRMNASQCSVPLSDRNKCMRVTDADAAKWGPTQFDFYSNGACIPTSYEFVSVAQFCVELGSVQLIPGSAKWLRRTISTPIPASLKASAGRTTPPTAPLSDRPIIVSPPPQQPRILWGLNKRR